MIQAHRSFCKNGRRTGHAAAGIDAERSVKAGKRRCCGRELSPTVERRSKPAPPAGADAGRCSRTAPPCSTREGGSKVKSEKRILHLDLHTTTLDAELPGGSHEFPWMILSSETHALLALVVPFMLLLVMVVAVLSLWRSCLRVVGGGGGGAVAT